MVALVDLQPDLFIAVGMHEHDRTGRRLVAEREPGVGAERDQVMAARGLHQGAFEIRPGKRKNNDGVWPLAISSRSVSRIS